MYMIKWAHSHSPNTTISALPMPPLTTPPVWAELDIHTCTPLIRTHWNDTNIYWYLYYGWLVVYAHCFWWDSSGWGVGVVMLTEVCTGGCGQIYSHGIMYTGLNINIWTEGEKKTVDFKFSWPTYMLHLSVKNNNNMLVVGDMYPAYQRTWECTHWNQRTKGRPLSAVKY